MLKTVLFGFMSNGYISLRELADNCKVNLRYMYLVMDPDLLAKVFPRDDYLYLTEKELAEKLTSLMGKHPLDELIEMAKHVPCDEEEFLQIHEVTHVEE